MDGGGEEEEIVGESEEGFLLEEALEVRAEVGFGAREAFGDL